MKLRLDALIRQSRASEAGRSPEQQREAIARWAESDGATVIAEHVGRGRSGKSIDRLDVNAALERIRAGETDGVVVAWLNRLSRAPVEDALRVIREINEAGGKLVSVDHGGVLKDDPLGEQMVTMDLANARRQWRETAERYAQNRKEAIATGKHIGKAPFGYRFKDPTAKKGSHGVLDSHLVVHAEEKEIVLELFERKANGATWLELARWLDAAAPKPNGTKWARSTVIDMIGSRVYLGEVAHGNFKNPKAHERIVSPALWRRAQNGPGRRTPRGTYLLSGLARCESCGRTLRGSALGRNGKRIYTCANRGCKARSTIMVHLLDAEVTEQFFAHIEDFHIQRVSSADLGAARDAVEERTAEVETLAAIVPKHPSAIAAHQAALEAAEGALAEAEDRLDELTAAALADGPNVRELRAEWPSFTLAERREVLRGAIDAVLVRRAPSPTAKPPVADRIRVAFRS